MEQLIGRKVMNDIINNYGVTIIPAQSILNSESIKLIINHKIESDSIILSTEKKSDVETNDIIEKTVNRSRELLTSISSTRKIPLMEIRREILPAIQTVSKNTELYELFEFVKAKDDYTYQHNIGVGIIATLIGQWMNLDETELAILSLAATLHDVGKVKIPTDILNKPGKLTAEEFQLVKKHTVFGYEMLKETTGISQRVANVALQHHERDDGNGYPLGLKKGNIDTFSSIVAVADIFHAMSSKRPYHDPIPFQEIISQMRQGKFGELNPQIVSVFLDNIMKRLVGKQVVLTDGRVGEVIYLNPHSIETPLIKVADQFLDLSHERSIQIKDIIISA
ncbi:HD-GYP domain-containing protein [Cohnella abietis]|uniref:HD family phosphohydrolase n=1 Tax=Cohnella abietis TaxID=2507935 RepID=A0A3T1DAN8_9BACL|nr:HD-GYP domain-containing protein [Cohnella abietis]BBI35150.1 HD family phosphohydrolase [Cohnella abietis]